MGLAQQVELAPSMQKLDDRSRAIACWKNRQGVRIRAPLIVVATIFADVLSHLRPPREQVRLNVDRFGGTLKLFRVQSETNTAASFSNETRAATAFMLKESRK